MPDTTPSPAPTQRFSDRVDDYVRYRPSYPAAVMEAPREYAGLGPSSVVADIGSGTGIFALLLLRMCARVYGVEPNEAMRVAGERLLAGWTNFASVAGTAEATGMPDASVDLVTAALRAFYGAGGYAASEFPNEQRFDLAGLRGRVLSSSYAPNIGHPGHEALMSELASLFGRHAQDGHVTFHYTTRLFVGRLS